MYIKDIYLYHTEQIPRKQLRRAKDSRTKWWYLDRNFGDILDSYLGKKKRNHSERHVLRGMPHSMSSLHPMHSIPNF